MNGYSGFFPSEAVELRKSMNRTFPSTETFATFADSGAALLAVRRDRFSTEELDDCELDGIRLKLVFDDSDDVAVYELVDSRRGNE